MIGKKKIIDDVVSGSKNIMMVKELVISKMFLKELSWLDSVFLKGFLYIVEILKRK